MVVKEKVKKEHWGRVKALIRRYDVHADVNCSPDGNAFLEAIAEATREAAEPVGAGVL